MAMAAALRLRPAHLRGWAVACALALLAVQSIGLPWHLATEHHGAELIFHAAHADAAGRAGNHGHDHDHEHPGLPRGHDEDAHHWTTVAPGGGLRVKHDAAASGGAPALLAASPSAPAPTPARGMAPTPRAAHGRDPARARRVERARAPPEQAASSPILTP